MKEFIDFNTIREDYSIFKLENGCSLRIKVSLTSLYNDIVGNKKSGKLSTNVTARVELPMDFDVSNLEEVDNGYKGTEKDNVKELKITESKTVINLYETDKSIIVLALNVDHVFATNKKYKSCIPSLRYDHVVATAVTNKPFVDGNDVAIEPTKT